MKILFIADPVDQLKPAGDSTLALLRAALKLGHACYWATDRDVGITKNVVTADVARVSECLDGALPRLDGLARLPLTAMKICFVRRDPPFDASYVKLCWLLQLAEHKVRFINRPSLLLRFHEKLVPLAALATGFLKSGDVIPTYIGDSESAAIDLQSSEVVVKPFLGFGGSDLQKIAGADFKMRAHTLMERSELAQPFQPEVVQGDWRVFFWKGKRIAEFARVPAKGNFISNLAQGGSAESKPLRKSQVAVLDRLGKFLKKEGIALAGADLIGSKISEVNITSPTGLQQLHALEGKDYATKIIQLALT